MNIDLMSTPFIVDESALRNPQSAIRNPHC